MEISRNFDGASIGLYDYKACEGTLYFDLARNERGMVNHSFCFYCSDAPSHLKVVIRNANKSIFAHGWQGYAPFAKADESWRRTEKAFQYDGASASLELENLPPNFMLAWYPPYPSIRLNELLGAVAENPDFKVTEEAGVRFVEAGNPEGPRFFILGRQHPGETMASFFVEGFLKKLADNSSESRNLLAKYKFSIVPLANPSGAEQGFHRTDPEGNDYNLCWNRSDIPEINAIKGFLGCGQPPVVCLDVHGDEVSKGNYFFYNPRMVSSANQGLFDSMMNLSGVKPLKMPADWQFFFKELISHYRIIVPKQEAAGYFEEHYNSLALVLELGAHRQDPSEHSALGKEFVGALS